MAEEPEADLDHVSKTIGDAQQKADRLAENRAINPEDVEDTEPADQAPVPRG